MFLWVSIAGFRGLPQSPSYCASKAALYAYGQSLRVWLKRYKIQVSVICPGFVKTDLADKLSGYKPFLISPEKASRIIYKGLLKNKARIIFPWPLYLLVKISLWLPEKPVNAVLKSF